MKKAIVTGSTGFIGSALVRYLLGKGIKVLALGRKNPDKIDSRILPNSKNLTYSSLDLSLIHI